MVRTGQSDVFSLPCMVDHHHTGEVGDNKHENIESRSGLLFFQPSNQRRPGFILSTYTPSDEGRRLRNRLILFGKTEGDCTNVLAKIGSKKGVKAFPIVAWQCQAFSRYLRKVFQPRNQWSLTYDDDNNRTKPDVVDEAEILSWFILYGVDRNLIKGFDSTVEDGNARPLCLEHVLRPGLNVITRSYPFGPDVVNIFTDAMSSGVVSNISILDHGSLFLTDARCLPGSEGGGVYTSYVSNSHTYCGELIGMIVSPLCWKTQELVGMTVCCSVQGMLLSLTSVMGQLSYSTESPEIQDFLKLCTKGGRLKTISTTINGGDPTIVRVDVGGIWGSGVIVGAKLNDGKCEVIIVTCRHVVERAIEMKHRKVNVTFEQTTKRYFANILFASNEDSAYDLAILRLKVEKDILAVLTLDKLRIPSSHRGKVYIVPHSVEPREFIKGSSVYIKGYALFDIESELGPTLSEGVLSNVAYHHDDPVLLHSTCLVHKGVSGGGLICSHTGKLQGVIVNHVKDDDGGISFPDVNFIIPSRIFMPAVMKYLTNEQSFSVFNCLNCSNSEVHRIWKMRPLQSDTLPKVQSKL